jgi:hypothetical protein
MLLGVLSISLCALEYYAMAEHLCKFISSVRAGTFALKKPQRPPCVQVNLIIHLVPTVEILWMMCSQMYSSFVVLQGNLMWCRQRMGKRC